MANAIPVTGRASIPTEANQKGGLNESTPPEQRKPKAATEDNLSDGPIMGEKGEYLPASYKQTHTSEATAFGPGRTHTLIRTDR